MLYLHFESPPTPHFITAGAATYRKGDRHKKRTNIGIFDLIFVTSGELYIAEEDTYYVLKENHLLLLSPDKTHHGFKFCHSETHFYWLHIGHSGEHYESTHLHPAQKQSTSLYREALFYVTLAVQKVLTNDEAALLTEYIRPLLSFAVNKYDNETKKVHISSDPLQRQCDFLNILNFLNLSSKVSNAPGTLAFEIMQYLQNNYDKSFTIEELAAKYNFHPVHIIRCMKKTYHMTPIQALTQIRLRKSKELLLTTSCSISEVGEQVGFSTSSYFIKKFKAHFHQTPAQYRKTQI